MNSATVFVASATSGPRLLVSSTGLETRTTEKCRVEAKWWILTIWRKGVIHIDLISWANWILNTAKEKVTDRRPKKSDLNITSWWLKNSIVLQLITETFVINVCLYVAGTVASWTVSSLILQPSGPGSSPGRDTVVLFVGKALYSHSASLHPDVKMGTGKLNAGVNPAMD